jgi:MFS family permease
MGMEHVALGWLVLEVTDSPFMIGVASAARMAPFFFLGIVSGAVADRVDRRTYLRWLALAASALAGLTALVLSRDLGNVWPIILLAVGMGCVWAFTLAARQAYIYDIVGPEQALSGLALSALSQRVGGVVGALVAGVLIATVGIEAQYLAIAISYASGSALLLLTRDPGQAAVREIESVGRNLIGSFKLLRDNRTLLILMCLAAITEVFGFTHQSLLPVFARDVLGMGAVGLGVLSAFRQGGGIVGLLLLVNLGDYRRKGLLMFMVAGTFGVGLMAFSLGHSIFAFAIILVVVNASASVVDTLYKTLMQSNVANEERGRAMGSWVLSIGVAPVGHLGVGALAAVLGAPGALLVNGGMLLCISVLAAVGLPRIRRLE